MSTSAAEELKRARDEDGSILLVTLLLTLVLATAATVLLRDAAAAGRSLAGHRAAAEARLGADAGLEFALSVLEGAIPAALDGFEYRFGRGGGRIAVEAESAKVDLNEASPELRSALREVVGFELQAPPPHPSGRPIHRTVVSALAPCQRLTSARVRLETYATVATRHPTVSRTDAREELLRRIPGVGTYSVDVLLSERSGITPAAGAVVGPPLAGYLGETAPIFRVTATYRLDSGVVSVRRGLALLTPQAVPVYVTVEDGPFVLDGSICGG